MAADASAAIAHFESASAELQNPHKRAEAEQFLLEFRKRQDVVFLSQNILFSTTKPDAQFHATLALTDAIVRDYSSITKEQIQGLRRSLIELLVKRPSTAPVVSNVVVRAVAISVKRGWMEDSPADRHAIFHLAAEIFSNSDVTVRRVALLLLDSIVDEFSSTKSSSIGLPWDTVFRAKQTFEQAELGEILQLLINVLKHSAQVVRVNGWKRNADAVHFDTACLRLSEKILGWDFVKAEDLLSGSFRTRDRVHDGIALTQRQSDKNTDYPASWRAFLVNVDVIGTFFELYSAIILSEPSDESAQYCVGCLEKLCALPRMPSATAAEKQTSSAVIMSGVKNIILQTLHTGTNVDLPRLCYAAVLVKAISASAFADTPEFLQSVANLTLLGIAKAKEDPTEDALQEAEDAVDDLLDAWSAVHMRNFPNLAFTTSTGNEVSSTILPVLKSFAANLVPAYLEMRTTIAEFDIDAEEEDDGEESDHDRYLDELTQVAQIARYDTKTTLSLLLHVLHTLLSNLGAEYSSSNSDAKALDSLHERLHWTLLLATTVLTENPERGEKPLIPTLLVRFSQEQEAQHEQPDLLITLIHKIMEAMTIAIVDPSDQRLAEKGSPRVAESLMWFLRRWAGAYIFVDAQDYGSISTTLVTTFGRPQNTGSTTATGALEFIMESLRRTFMLHSTESNVLRRATSVLELLARNQEVVNLLLHTGSFQHLAKYLLNHLSRSSPQSIDIVRALTRLTSQSSDDSIRFNYVQSIASAIEASLNNVVRRQDFKSIYQQGQVMSEIECGIQMLSGFASASDESNSSFVYAVCSRHFTTVNMLFELYRADQAIATCVFEFYESIVSYQRVELMTSEEKQLLYRAILDMVSSFSRLKQGEKSSSKTLQEDELQEDIVMLLNLLSNLLVNECENDFREEIRHGRGALSAAAPNGGELDAPQLAFSCIDHLLRLTNRDLLDYPALCLALLDLVCELVSFFPQRLNRVDQGLFQSVFRLLRYGVETANTDANEFAYTAIGAIAAHRRNMELLSADPSAARLDTELDQTFWAVMQTVLQMGQLPNELIESASEAVLALACARKATYIGIMTQLGASARTSDSFPRLNAALSFFNSALDLAAQRWIENYPKVLQTTDNASDSASFLPLKGSVYTTVSLTNKEFSEWRTSFVRGILEVRGLLRVT